jgi:hypothetical protein
VPLGKGEAENGSRDNREPLSENHGIYFDSEAKQTGAMFCALQERNRTTHGNRELTTSSDTARERKRGLVQAPSFL